MGPIHGRLVFGSRRPISGRPAFGSMGPIHAMPNSDRRNEEARVSLTRFSKKASNSFKTGVNQLIYKEILLGSGTNSYRTNGLLIYDF